MTEHNTGTPRTQSDLLNNFFQGGQANNSITSQDMRDFVASAGFLTPGAWQFYLDGEFTSGSPLAVTAGTRTQLTIDGAFGILGHPAHPEIILSAWDLATNKVVPGQLNGFGTVRLAFMSFSEAGATNRFELEFDVGGGTFPIIFQETGIYAKGLGLPNVQSYNFAIPLFVGPDFFANGGTFFVTPENDASFYQAAITITLSYAPHPSIPGLPF